MCYLLHTYFTLWCAVLHALILRIMYVGHSNAITEASVKETTFELCVVEPGKIMPQEIAS